jgi:hypothetical protein
MFQRLRHRCFVDGAPCPLSVAPKQEHGSPKISPSICRDPEDSVWQFLLYNDGLGRETSVVKSKLPDKIP